MWGQKLGCCRKTLLFSCLPQTLGNLPLRRLRSAFDPLRHSGNRGNCLHAGPLIIVVAAVSQTSGFKVLMQDGRRNLNASRRQRHCRICWRGSPVQPISFGPMRPLGRQRSASAMPRCCTPSRPFRPEIRIGMKVPNRKAEAYIGWSRIGKPR
jgi:hypothetical protein